jgi:hypothetical protein
VFGCDSVVCLVGLFFSVFSCGFSKLFSVVLSSIGSSGIRFPDIRLFDSAFWAADLFCLDFEDVDFEVAILFLFLTV